MKKNKRVLCAIITATAVNLTAVAPAYAAARELPSELPRSPAPNPPAANDPIYNQKQKPNFNKLAKKIAKNPANIRKILNPYSFGGSLALDLIVDQVGKLIDNAGELQWSESQTQADTGPCSYGGYKGNSINDLVQQVCKNICTDKSSVSIKRFGSNAYDFTITHSKYGTDYSDRAVCGPAPDEEPNPADDPADKVESARETKLIRQIEKLLQNAYDQQLSSDTDSMLDPKEEATADATAEAKADARGEAKANPKEQANAKADPKPQELPTFCDWAAPVCGLIDWLKEEPQLPEPTKPKLVENDTSWLAPAEKSWVNFGSATCPQDIIIPIQFGNNTQNITISYVPFCKFAQMIKPAVILGAYLSALMIIVGGRQREG